MTPDVIIESSIPTPESNHSNPNSSQNRSNFHSFNIDNVPAIGSPDDQSAASSGGGGGGGGGLSDTGGRGGSVGVMMETSFRVMSPESEMAAASLRQGLLKK